MSKFHLRLRELRNSRKMSQQELADCLKISKSSINMYERGERDPGLDMLEAIADFFNVDLDYLTGKTLQLKTFENWDKTYNSEKMSKESETFDKIKECFGKKAVAFMRLFVDFNIEGQEKLLDIAMDMSELDRYKQFTKPHVIKNTDVKHVMQAARDGETVGVVETTAEEETQLTNTPLLNFDL